MEEVGGKSGPMPSFGQRLRERRKALGLTQLEVALSVGCAEATIQKIEADARRPSRQMAHLLAVTLGVPAEERPAFVIFARTGSLPEAAVPGVGRTAAGAGTTNMPLLLRPFFGRERELASVRDFLLSESVRMVTVVGPPGVGKTSLAIRAAGELSGSFADGVWFVALAAAGEPNLVLPLVAQALGLKADGARSVEAGLGEYLSGKEMLLVLDNLEQVAGAGPRLVDLLQRAPGLKIVLTSRAALNVSPEQQVALAPLPLPDLGALPGLEAIGAYPSVELFMERARAVDPGFELTEENAGTVAAICVRLDGLPLAIELVAARARLLPPDALLARLDNRLALLRNGPRDLPARHQTLRDAMAWSYDLLDAEERSLFRRMGVFVGGGTLAAIEAVCNARGDLPRGTLEVAGSLLDKSLLRQEAGWGAEPRFSMLETVREYALEKLEESGEGVDVRKYHIESYIALAEAAEPQFNGAQSKMWLDRLEREHDNVRAALAWAEEQSGLGESALRLAGVTWRFWALRGYYQEGRDRLARLLDRAKLAGDPEARARLLSGAGYLAFDQGDLAKAATYFEESLLVYRGLGNQSGIAQALNGLGTVSQERGLLREARGYFEESLEIRTELGEERAVLQSLNNLAAVLMDAGEGESEPTERYSRARALFERSVMLAEAAGSETSKAWALSGLGDLARLEGDYSAARRLHEQSLEIHRKTGDGWSIALQLNHLGTVALLQGDLAEATGYFRESVALAQERKQVPEIVRSLQGLGQVAEAQGDSQRAERLLGAASALLDPADGDLRPEAGADLERILGEA
ncbi:MAG: ATP-binding protein [Chloroflexia bacterium]